MIRQAGDIGVSLDTGKNQPGSILQRKEQGRWVNYTPDGKVTGVPSKLDDLPAGEYRLAVG